MGGYWEFTSTDYIPNEELLEYQLSSDVSLDDVIVKGGSYLNDPNNIKVNTIGVLSKMNVRKCQFQNCVERLKMAKEAIKILQTNRKAYFNYEIIEDFEAGIALVGTEVKSIRASRFSFADSYVKITAKGLVLVGLHISKYAHASTFNHDQIVIEFYWFTNMKLND